MFFFLLSTARVFAITGAQVGSSIVVSETPLSVSNLVTLFITWVIYIAGVLAFLYLVYSGILYITAGGNSDQAKKAQLGLINAIIGIVIVVLSYVILRAVVSLAMGNGTIL
jgi:hypothetical protein